MSAIDTLNSGFVGLHLGSGSITVQLHRARMTPDEALAHAAWLVATAQPFATHDFDDVLKAVQST